MITVLFVKDVNRLTALAKAVHASLVAQSFGAVVEALDELERLAIKLHREARDELAEIKAYPDVDQND